MIGKTVGRYHLRATIGRGGMGTVYEAWDPALERLVAIKVLAVSSNAADGERFRREARAIAALSHPNIVSVHEFGQQDGVTFIVMQLLRGVTMAHDIERGADHPLEWKLRVAGDICLALQHAHGGGMVHRDVKPANIHLGDDGVPRLLDFGVAHLTGSSLTLPCDILGTPAYLAPEILAGQTFDGRADVYSLGATLYEWITLRRIYDAPNVEALFWQILNVPAPPITQAWTSCPPQVASCIGRALHRNPHDRYADAGAFREDLLSVAAALRQVDAVVPDEATTASKPNLASRKHFGGRMAWSAIAVVVLLVISALLLHSQFLERSTPIDSISTSAATARTPAARQMQPPLPSANAPARSRHVTGIAPSDSALKRESPTSVPEAIGDATSPAADADDESIAAVLPIGTPLIVRVVDQLRTDRAHAGDSFSAQLAAPLMLGDLVVAPVGSALVGRVEAVGTSTHASLPFLDVSMTALMRAGHGVAIRTGRYRIQPPDPIGGSRVLTLIIGAATGAAIGGTAAGSKGAVVGGAAGATVAALAANEDPATVCILGDRLTFKLARALPVVPLQ